MMISGALIVALIAACQADISVDILPPHKPPQTLGGAPSAPLYHYGPPSTTPSERGDPKPYLYEPPANQYLPTFPKKSKESNEPTNGFAYTVTDNKSGNNFGHRETKQGKKTVGEYFVLLPDGRKQIVTYEADEDGYRPKIRYEYTKQG